MSILWHGNYAHDYAREVERHVRREKRDKWIGILALVAFWLWFLYACLVEWAK